MRALLPVAAGLASACASPALLADVPIEGGTDAVRAAIRAELVTFDEATGRGRVRVSRVRVEELGTRPGRINRLTRAVLLDDTLDEVEAVRVLRHELCHSLNLEEKLHRDEPILYERLARGVFGSAFADGDGCNGDFCQRHEVFAAYCQLGPWVAHAWREACPEEPTDGIAILGQMADEVWTDAEEPLPTQELPEWAAVALERPAEEVRAKTASPGIVEVSWAVDNHRQRAFFDVRTGERVSAANQSALAPPEGVPGGLPFEVPSFEEIDEPEGWPAGPYTTTVAVELYDLGTVARHVWFDGERWWLVGDGCAPVWRESFLAEERVFTVRPDGARIGWGPVSP